MELNKVFIINDSGHDFSSAESYGDLVPLTRGLFNRYDITGMYRTFEPLLSKSSSNDYILHCGPGVMSAVACSIFAAKHGRLNLLIWRAEENGTDRYVSRKIVFHS
jgi:hypothetical protein